MIHYHGGPITPDTCAIRAWKGRHAFISYAHPSQIGLASEICQSFALDNGAFSRREDGKNPDWDGFYKWVEIWKNHPGFDFAVIPDVIDGSEYENDELIIKSEINRDHAAVVWHTNESIDRLVRLANEWRIVCIGSSAEYDVSEPDRLLERMKEVLPYIVDNNGYPICKLHGLRMLNPYVFSKLPLSSADSTNVARNIGIDSRWQGNYSPQSKETRATILVERIESMNGAAKCLVDSQANAQMSIF